MQMELISFNDIPQHKPPLGNKFQSNTKNDFSRPITMKKFSKSYISMKKQRLK